ncbi:Trafficking protein particle complex subunit 13 [Geodia barretti]|uniref:Trafficking protein particle complex subunit 13 n=1 Tax=Geodia barretti TaxID=519541 RepID=A0AA35SGN8_GEOBA|nr:Trafficking protein particle complex subunit 13 [Geodia barretti]
MEGSVPQQHLLGLKVMRLTKPMLSYAVPVLGEPWDMLGTTLEENLSQDIRSPRDLPACSTGETLRLPMSFGLIFLGETFNGFISVHNDSQDVAKDVAVKVELLTPSHRPQLDPSACEERIISHEVKELGEHSLICTASYMVFATGEEMLLRKFFKFGVAKPLDVKTKFMNIEEDILLEVQIQNATPTHMFLDTVTFDPSAGFRAQDLNTIRTNNSEVSVFGKDNLLPPRNIRQHLYKLTPLGPLQTSGVVSNVQVGKMDIVWRSRFGERGRIQTGQLKATLPPLPQLKVTVVESPGTVSLERPFRITLRVHNGSGGPMRLRSVLEKHPGAGILWTGVTGKVYACPVHNELPAGGSMDMVVSLLPVLPGLQSFSPLLFVDVLSNQKKYHFNKLGQVFVEIQPPETLSSA